MITLLFIFTAITSVSIAYFLRFWFSSPDLKIYQALGCLCYNVFFCLFYLDLARNGCITFYECFPNLEYEYPVIAWGAFLCFVLHGFAHPMEWNLRVRFRKKIK